MFKNLWLKNKLAVNAKGGCGSLLFLLLSISSFAQLPQKWHLASGKLIDFTQEPPVFLESDIDLSTIKFIDLNNHIIQFGDSLLILDSSIWRTKLDGTFDIERVNFNNNKIRVRLVQSIDAIDSFVLYATRDSFLILRNTLTSKQWTIKLDTPDNVLNSFLLYDQTLKVVLPGKSQIAVYKLNNGLLEKSFDFKYKRFLGLSKDFVKLLGCELPIRINENEVLLRIRHDKVDTSFQIQLRLDTNRLVIEGINSIKTVKHLHEYDGDFEGYYSIGEIMTCTKSPNDSIFYSVKLEYERVKGQYYLEHLPTGRIILTAQQLYYPFEIDSAVITGQYSDFYSRSGIYDVSKYNLQVLNNGDVAFIRNCDHINRTNKRVSYLSYITKPNDFGNLKKRLRQKQIILDTIKRYDYGYYFPISATPYKKLRFLRAKQCTNELKLFADADSFYQKFEWHVANDTGGFDVFTGKNLQYPSKGKRTFYVKVKGIAKSGYFAWYSDTISFNTQPKAAFTMDTSQWCQWVGLQLQNTSISEGAKSNSFTWELLQNDTIKKTYLGKNPYLTFNANGSFDIRLIYNDGICVDTFTRKAAINIIPAPKPVFKIIDSAVCQRDSVIIIDKAIGQVSQRKFVWSDGFESSPKRHSRYFDSIGHYKIVQTLTGPTGCVTKDSQWVRIRPGFTQNDSTQLLFASVLDSQRILLKWKTKPNGMGYSIERSTQLQNSLTKDIMAPLQDSIIDTVRQTTRLTSYQYTLKMRDSCFNLSATSNTAQTIVLSRKNYNNEYIVLNWNAYETWQNGVKEYVIQSSENNSTWLPIDASGQLSYPDYRLPQLKSDTVYYRIKAIEEDGNNQYSYSNVVKVPLSTTLFIPNAFSPNNDGINDIFKVGHFGLKSFECKIYSKTGQIVAYSTNPNEIWDGSFNEEDYPMGNYRYIITATDIKGKALRYDGTLLLLR